MFPPETMQTTVPSPPWPASAAASGERSGALGDHAGALGEEADRGRGLVQRHGEGTVERLFRARPHLRQHHRGAGAVHERRLVVDRLRLAAREGGRQRRARLRLDRVDARLGPQRLDRARDPDAEPAAAERDEHGVRSGEVLQQLEPDRPVAGHHALVLDGMDEDAVRFRVAGGLERLPPAVVGHLVDPRAEPLHRRELGLGRVVGHDHRAGHAELARDPGDALAHVAGGRGDHAGPQVVRRDLEDGVACAAELERADRLQVLELQVDLAVAVVPEPDERRAQDAACQALACGLDLGERDQNGTAEPTPSARARS